MIPRAFLSSRPQLSLLKQVGGVARASSLTQATRPFHQASATNKYASVLNPASVRMLLIGAPGSGKGTQSNRIYKDFGLESISSGDVLRRHIRDGTPHGQLARDTMRSGLLLPDDIMLAILQSELDQLHKKNWLLDGFPRNVRQAQALDDKLHHGDSSLNLVIHLDVPEEVILDRLTDRWVHPNSGRIYHSTYNPPRTPGVDDLTGELLVQRDDDRPDVIKRRLNQFNELTGPLLDFYDSKDVLVSIKGSTSDAIYPKIQTEIARRLFHT